MKSFPFKIRISPDVISQDVFLGEVLLMNVKSLIYFGLDDLGAAVWRELQNGSEANAIFERVQINTGLPEETLAAKFEGIIKGLEASGIIALERLPQP